MNVSTFASSPAAGRLVVGLVGCITLAILVAIWTLAQLETARRLRRAKELRADRARRPRVASVGEGLRRSGTSTAELAPSAQRARAAGVDELQLEDDFAGFAEYGGALRR